jgi:DNA helicase HerA-like ATPase
MNTPVFAVPEGFGREAINQGPADFSYGHIPGTQINVVGPFADMIEYHTAILGVTGSGKTELAFDLIRYALEHETKVICIDLTARYKGRLTDLEPFSLSISGELSTELGQKISAVETTPYGAPAEKRALSQFAGRLRQDITGILTSFLTSNEQSKKIGIISLDEISNTKTTIFVTELYLTGLLNYARDNPTTCPRVLLVVEEAHTVMPETSTMGLGDNESKGLVAKIAQIALQGRKYRVGLLVIAQRTATVSKTVLTQCNTIVSFSCFDETSLGFFSNFFGKTHTAIIPNLQFLQAVIFGKGLKSQRPIIVQIPFSEEKAAADRR